MRIRIYAFVDPVDGGEPVICIENLHGDVLFEGEAATLSVYPDSLRRLSFGEKW